MKPISLSASSANCYELCPARWKAEWLHKAPSRGGSAANLGTALHLVVQHWVNLAYHLSPPRKPMQALADLWDDAYWKCFSDLSRHEEGWKLLLKWHARQDWKDRVVLSTESKQNFVLRTSAGEIPFNYIMDRVDQLANGDIEVIDYKSVMMPVTSDDLHQKLQPRCYALAASLEHPEAERIWVTFDLFRHEPVGTVFTAAECQETLAYLHGLAERILADEEAPEVLNAECRWCIRRQVCTTLNEHIRHAGETAAVGSFEEAVLRRAELDFAKKAIESQINDLDELITGHLTEDDRTEAEVGEYRVALTSPRRRIVDSARLAQQLDYPTFASLASISVSGLDDLLKSEELSAEQASLIRQAISWRNGRHGVSVKRR